MIVPLLATTLAAATAPHPLLGKTAPDFTLPRLTEGAVALASTHGRPLVLVFGSTEEAAPGCRDWMVTLDRNFRAAGPGGPQVFQVAVLDNPWYIPDFAVKARLRDFVPDFGYPLVLLEWKTAVGEAYHIPKDDKVRVFIIDRDGVVRWHYTGPITDERLLESLELIGKL